MVSVNLHTVHSLAILLITLTTVAYAAPLRGGNSSILSRNLLNTSAPHGFTTSDKVNKTILLNNGAAENQITYILHLRQFEVITAIIHISTDPTIITATSEIRQQLPHESQNAVNFTLLHEFDGHVGVAKYSFLVYTNVTNYRATGTYTVAGIVVFGSEKRTPLSIASGINSPGLAFKPSSFGNSIDGGTLRLEVQYEPVGSDITGTPPSLKQVLSKANVDVKDIKYGTASTLVTYDDSCSLIEPSVKSMNAPKRSMHCGICFNLTDQSLSITVNPERSGTSVIQLMVPTIEVNGETFETDIRIFVKKPPLVNPAVLIQPGTKLLLDYFGTEVFYIQMYNIIQPDQPVNATDFFIDLGMNRYASADLSLSRLEQPIQTIAFVVQPPGKEDQAILKKIQAALMILKGMELDSPEATPDVLSTLEPVPTMDMATDEVLAPAKFSLGPFNLENTTASRIEDEYPAVRMPQIRIGGPPSVEQLRMSSIPLNAVYVRIGDKDDYYESNAHVILPPALSLRTAKNVLNNPLLTMFAANETAVVSSKSRQGDAKHVLISLFLANYSLPTFSEHKSKQISASLSEAIRNATDEPIMNGNLTLLKANATGIQVTYAIPLLKDAEKIAKDVMQNKTDIGNQVSKAIWIPSNRLVLMNAMVYDPSSPSASDAVSTPENFLGGLSGPLLAVIIVLVLVALIPLSALCIGYLTSGTYPGEAESSPRISDDTGASYTRMPPVLRDTLGRATEGDDQESFKMDEEMSRKGDYADNTASREQ
ncbi:hypothetical protein FGB62_87g082 [Gracilaria domingensis]|nr:hypothetical protein FGB62_87g082 [Gracilaria domingensis]